MGSLDKRTYDGRSVTLAVTTMDRFRQTVETFSQVRLDAFEEVIVVDDSTDTRLRDWCKQRPVSYHRGPGKNRQAARNVAISESETPLLAFVDDDVLLPTNFASRVADAFSRAPEAAAVGGPTLSPEVSWARDLCYRERMTVNPLTGSIHDDSYRWIPNQPTEVDLLRGANMAFKRRQLERIGGFDTAFGGPAQREETDVFVRLSDYGPIIYDPALLCFHKQSGSASSTADLVEWRFRNHGYFVYKNFGLSTFLLGFVTLFPRICGNPDSVAQLLFRRAVLGQEVSVGRCLSAYLAGGKWCYKHW
jgi:GT2 family glycosyltransferase